MMKLLGDYQFINRRLRERLMKNPRNDDRLCKCFSPHSMAFSGATGRDNPSALVLL